MMKVAHRGGFDVAVVGAGAIGGFFGAQLAAVGCRVAFCSRQPFDHIVVESDTAPVSVPSCVAVLPSDLAPGMPHPRWILLAVKAHQTPHAAEWLTRLCGPESSVVVFQNGIEGADRVRAITGASSIVPTVVYCGAELLSPGRIRHAGEATVIVPDDKDACRFAALFDPSPVTVRVSADFQTESWRKLGTNLVANGITALTGRPLGVLADPEMLKIATAVLHECWAVANAEGAHLDERDLAVILERLMSPEAASVAPSMLQDRLNQRPTEHDALYGAVVRAGRRHAIATPLAHTMGTLIAAGDRHISK